ncbi:MAG: DNA gyrase subunit A [Halodesulfurarchaeum sp.]
MSSELPEPSGQVGDEIETVRVEDEMEQSYIDYAMSVIAGRALPDVRDGLKPVHRRILYAMHESGITSNAGHRKSSSVVGDTMGNYHPHGDSAIYDTLVRMAQDFSMRYPLIDGQGNFGSIDGDPAAAMRYTESRMAPIAEELLADIEKDTVDFEPNYDDRLEEPSVLPAAVPNLLVNGSSGIAVGMSTNVPPHNLGEVVDAAIHLLENPAASVADLMEFVPGPDFPTGATIVGKNAIKQAYETGRGRLTVRANYELEDGERGDRIVITELPYQQNKSKLVERIADMVNEGTLEGVRDLRDESDRAGIRVVIELKRGANTDIVENRLLESVLERTFGVINLALVDGNPEVLSLKEMLQHYLDHRRTVVRRRSEYELGEAEDRAHILEGRLHALENAEDIVELIRDSPDRDAAKERLQASFDFSAEQAQHIVRMQLGSLTSMERGEIEDEYERVTARIERLETILSDPAELRAVIKTELREQKETYGDGRRTSIVEADGEVTDEDLIPQEDVLITLSEADYIKRVKMDAFSAQHRGGKGIIGADLKEGDRIASAFPARTHDTLLCFTDAGQVYRLKAYEVPEMSRSARGTSAVNLLELDPEEDITAVVAARDVEDEYLTMVTREGYVKRTPAEDFENIRSTGIIATRLDDGDELVDVEITDGESQLMIGTRQGRAIRFAEADVRPMGRTARGVRGITLEPGDAVAGVTSVRPDDDRYLLTVTENGYGKRTPLSEYRPQSRNGKGLMDIKTGERNGPVATLRTVSADDHVIAMSEAGQITRMPVAEISAIGRNTKGVLVMRVEATDRLAEVSVFRPLETDAA